MCPSEVAFRRSLVQGPEVLRIILDGCLEMVFSARLGAKSAVSCPKSVQPTNAIVQASANCLPIPAGWPCIGPDSAGQRSEYNIYVRHSAPGRTRDFGRSKPLREEIMTLLARFFNLRYTGANHNLDHPTRAMSRRRSPESLSSTQSL